MVWVQLWLGYAVWAHWAGWALSAVGMLHARGYVVAIMATVACAMLLRRHVTWPGWHPCFGRRGILPKMFAAVAVVTALGALLYDPANYDFHSYRLPRMLMWLREGRWHWIAGADWRMNSAGTAQEWMLMPLLVLGVPLRFAFLPSLVSFLLLPGLLFRFYRQLAVSRGIAWQAMWLVPMASMFVLQAGAATNDLLGTGFAMAAFVFAADYRRTSARSTFFWGMAAAALMTAVKPTNIPLLLPLAIVLLPSAGRLLTRPLATFGTLFVAAGLSYLPVMVGSAVHHGTPFYVGTAAAPMESASGVVKHALHVAGDIVEGLFAAPVNPLASRIEALFASVPVLRHLMGSSMVGVSEILMEEECGLGIALTAWCVWMMARTRRKRSVKLTSGIPQTGFVAATLIASAAFAGIVNSPTNQRLFMPYYPLLLGVLLATRGPTLSGMRAKGTARWLQTIVFLSALTSLMMTPARPLWPAMSVSRFLRQRAPDSGAVRRLADVYAVYRARPDALGPVREALRPEDRVIAFFGTGDDLTTALWRPLGTRRVVWLPREALDHDKEIRDWLAACDVWVANEAILRRRTGDVDAWCKSLGYHLESTVQARMKVSDDRTAWCIIRRGGAETSTSARPGAIP